MPLPGAAAGEVAFYRADGRGLVMVGDALIHMGSHGFAVLPDKYCENSEGIAPFADPAGGTDHSQR